MKTEPLAIHVCEVGTFKAGSPAPDGYGDRIEWHKVQRKAGYRQAACPGCDRWFYSFQEHDRATCVRLAGREKK